MRGTHLSKMIKSQNKIIYTVFNVLNIFITYLVQIKAFLYDQYDRK
jgi:hypothetical protein